MQRVTLNKRSQPCIDSISLLRKSEIVVYNVFLYERRLGLYIVNVFKKKEDDEEVHLVLTIQP